MQISSRFTMAIHMFACIDTFSDQKMTSDFEGIQLITVSNKNDTDGDDRALPGFSLKLNLLDE